MQLFGTTPAYKDRKGFHTKGETYEDFIGRHVVCSERKPSFRD